MSAVSVLEIVSARLDYLRQEEGAPVTQYGEDLRNSVEQLRSDLGEIKQFLLASNSKIDVSNLNEQVVQLAYDIENVVECHAVGNGISSPGGRIKSIFRRCSGRNPLDDDFDSINRRIERIKFYDSGASKVEAEGGVDQTIGSASNSSRSDHHFPLASGPPIIDKEYAKTVLLDILLSGDVNNDDLISSSSQLIAILCSTTTKKPSLAREVFYNPDVVDLFECRAWAKVSQEFNPRDVLEAILDSLSPEKSSRVEIAMMETMELLEQLYVVQTENKCLIVLDDVCSTDAWETMRFAFPKVPRNRILINTHHKEVAQHFKVQVHDVQKLTDSESKELFEEESRIRFSEMFSNPEIKEAVNKMLSQCQGVRSEIIAVANKLKGLRMEDWNRTLQVMNATMTPQDWMAPLYDKLPLYLKPCLLYVGQFPPDKPIPVDKLYLMWMAEGLILTRSSSNDSEQVVERLKIVEEYLSDLVERDLVLVDGNDKMINSCQLNDLIRDLCMLKGKEEGFFRIIDFENGSKSSSLKMPHRVAIYLNDNADGEHLSSDIPEANQVRSLLFFGNGNDKSTCWPVEVADLKDFQWTRVLDFDGVDFRGANNNNKIPKNIDKLLYLRYLGFRGCYLEKLELSFSDFKYLETLDLRVTSSCKMIIPNVLWKLLNLIHLYFPISFQSDDQSKLKLGGLTRLEILENFHIGICNADELVQFEHLKIITVMYNDGDTLDLSNVIKFIEGHKNLRHTSLTLKKFDCYTKDRQVLLGNVLQCHSLHCLHLEGHLRRMPEKLNIAQKFTKIIFDGCEILQDPMEILGRLPNLMTLVLCNDAILAEEIECSESSFIRLISLKMANLQYLKVWLLDSEAMPVLSIVTIEQCPTLESIPSEIGERVCLSVLNIGSMHKDFENSVRALANEQLENGNEQLNITFYDFAD